MCWRSPPKSYVDPLRARCYKRVFCSSSCVLSVSLTVDTRPTRKLLFDAAAKMGTLLFIGMPCGGSLFGTSVSGRERAGASVRPPNP